MGGYSLLLLSLLLVAACAREAKPPEATVVSSAVQGLVESAAAQLPEDLLERLDTLGEALRVEAEAVDNPHDPAQRDSVRTLHYEGWELTSYHTDSGDAFLIGVRTTAADHVTAEGLRIGSHRQEVEATLGAPTVAEDGMLLYVLFGEGPTPPRQIVVWLEEDRIAALEWLLYWG